MRLAVISDVHGNLEALKEVLADIDRSQIDTVVCLGDNVGYGPCPEEVIELINQRDISCVMGNHELAVIDQSYLEWFNPEAQESIIQTKKLLSQDTLGYIHTLGASMTCEGCLCVHGSPPDSITTYIFELMESELQEIFIGMKEKICFVGHTHDLEVIVFDGEEIAHGYLYEGLMQLDDNYRYIINVGSVGQPRDGNNNAKYVIWDDISQILEVKFIPYDIAATANKIIELGFPEFNATRLW